MIAFLVLNSGKPSASIVSSVWSEWQDQTPQTVVFLTVLEAKRSRSRLQLVQRLERVLLPGSL